MAEDRYKPWRWGKWRWIIALVITGLALIVILQNRAAVDTQILWITIKMPRVLLLLSTLLIGFVVGLLLGRRWSRRE